MNSSFRFITLGLLGIVVLLACKSGRQQELDQIRGMEQALKNDTADTPDINKAVALVGLYDEFVTAHPDDSMSSEYLFRAADISQGVHHDSLAVAYYQRICTNYPTSRKAAASLFMMAFVYQNNLSDNDKAKAAYTDFLGKYPEHQLAASAQGALQQLEMGLSDEELIRMFQQKQDSLDTAAN